MTVEIKPETERLVREEIQRGHVHSVDELIQFAVQALRQKHPVESSPANAPPRKPRKNLYELLSQPPFAGSELDLERQKDYPRDLDL
jgi:Arc/MetJ-type ribon-helix-helix transcriptional regulator